MTSKQRAYLRSLANTMEPILHIGKEGVTQGVAQQAWDALGGAGAHQGDGAAQRAL